MVGAFEQSVMPQRLNLSLVVALGKGILESIERSIHGTDRIATLNQIELVLSDAKFVTVVSFVELDPSTLDERVNVFGLVAEFVWFGLGKGKAHGSILSADSDRKADRGDDIHDERRRQHRVEPIHHSAVTRKPC